MNKTVTINLGGFIFHIDEIAYAVLKNYLESVGKSLNDDPQGKSEILADIESRISELLSEKIKNDRQVINEDDINDVIAIMGQPEDYAEAEEGYTDTRTTKKRKSSVKKLYRDGDDKFLGGVASGLGHYFDVDAIWMRLLFIFLTFGGGFAVPTYIILWILLPEAKTTSEKLEMEGEPVTIDNIEKKIRNEYENLSEKIKNVDYSKTKSGFQNFLDEFGKILLLLFKIFSKIIGFALMFVAAIFIIVILLLGFSYGSIEAIGISEDFVEFIPFIYDTVLPRWVLTITLIVAIGFPFLILFLLGLRIISPSVKQFSKPTSLTLLAIWIISILAIIFTAVEKGSANAFEGVKVSTEQLDFIKNDTLKLKVVNDDNLFVKSRFRRSYDQKVIFIDENKKLYSNNVEIDVVQSNDEYSHVTVKKESEGKNRKDANENAEEIQYKHKIVNDSFLLDGYFISDFGNRYKQERIHVTIAIPEGVVIYFTNSVHTFIYDIENTQRIYDGDMINHHFLMTNVGLECTDCDPKVYRN